MPLYPIPWDLGVITQPSNQAFCPDPVISHFDGETDEIDHSRIVDYFNGKRSASNIQMGKKLGAATETPGL
jgi:hypothetical protein